MSYYREQLESFLKTLDIKADHVIDIGGAANPVKDRVKSWDVKGYSILDNGTETPKDETYYTQMDLNIPFVDDTPEGYYAQPADIVFCLEVMEYIFDPLTAIKGIYALTKKGGVVYITFPFIYPIHNPTKFDYLRYTNAGVFRLMEEVGFKNTILYPRKQKGTLDIGQWFSSEGMHAAKTADHSEIGYIAYAEK